MMLAGFSQGGALSLVTGLQLSADKKLAGVLVMSGYLARAKEFVLTPGLEGVPVLHGHGSADPMVRTRLRY
jgi:predicted esterase